MNKPAGSRLWREAVRDVKPLPGRAPAAAPNPPPRPAAAAALDGDAGVDRATAERLKRGQRRIEARLDLHGMTQAEAYRALTGFLVRAREEGRRCVLVITGRGLSPSGPGVLKTAVPRWLAEAGLRRHVLTAAQAQPRDGGAGALYLLLRRR